MPAPSNPVCSECGFELIESSIPNVCPRCTLKICFDEELEYGAPEGAETALAGPEGFSQIFGDYELIAEIARGGMGVVFKARQRSLDRPVALKMLLPGRLGSSAALRRFHTEAEAAARLQHPNIVAIHEVGEFEGQHFYSMDIIDGPDLARRVQNGPISPEDAARYVRIISEAIHYAHQRGVLHRDLKPANVLIDPEDMPHVTDFGLAKLLDGKHDLTVTGHVLGTPSFMPPEQADPSRGEMTVASDVYGLGAILYFLLVGKAPFQAESFELTLLSLLSDDPHPPTHIRASIPKDLETICLKCLSKEPERRYHSAAQLAEDLARWTRHEPIHARPVPRLERIWSWARRNPTLSGLTLALIGSLIAGLTLQQLALRQARHARSSAEDLIQFMNENLTDTLRPLGRLEMLSNVNAHVGSYYEKLPVNGESTESLMRRAHFHRNTASVLREQGKLIEAESNARTAVAILDPIQQRQPKASLPAAELARAHTVLQQVLTDAGTPEAISHARRAVELCELVCRLDEGSVEARSRLAAAQLELGSVLLEGKRYEEAGPEIDAGANLLDQMPKTGANAASWRAQLAKGRYYQGLVDLGRGKKEHALTRFEEYLHIFEQLAQEEPANTQWKEGLMSAHAYLGSTLKSQGNPEEAWTHFREYRRVASELFRHDPSNVVFQRELGLSLEWLALVRESQQAPSAEIGEYLQTAYEQFSALARNAPDRDDWQEDAARTLTEWAEWRLSHGELAAACTLLSNEVTNRWDLLFRSNATQAPHKRFLRALVQNELVTQDQNNEQRLHRAQGWLARMKTQAPKQGREGWWRLTNATLHDHVATQLRENQQFEMSVHELREAQPLWLELASESPADDDLYSTSLLSFYTIAEGSLSYDDIMTAIRTTATLLDWSERQPLTASRTKNLRRKLAELCGDISARTLSTNSSRKPEALDLAQRCLKEAQREQSSGDNKEADDIERLTEIVASLSAAPAPGAIDRSIK